MTPEHQYDLLIAGGGLVGATLAIALSGTGLRVALVEAVPFGDAAQPSYDDRSIALAYGSRRIFETLGVWRLIEQQGVTSIDDIHISHFGRFGAARLSAGDAGVEHLGYVAAAQALGAALQQRLRACDHVTFLCPARLTDFRIDEGGVQATLAHPDGSSLALRARLLVGADGGQSQVRTRLGIEAQRADYRQTALIANITPSRPHRHTAYERFTPQGPAALLPIDADRFALVYCLPPEQVPEALALDDAAFAARLHRVFGTRAGRFTRIGARSAYPLTLTRVADPVRPRAVVIGNAAHTLHPVAGQGFNLGLRDAATLAELLARAARDGDDIADAALLARYAAARRHDTHIIRAMTNGLLGLFTNDSAALALVRGLGLVGLDLAAPLKRVLLAHTMGLAGTVPRLARGLALG